MRTKKRNAWLGAIFVCIVVALAMSMTAFAGEADAAAEGSRMYATGWSLVPPLVAIILALITKDVYPSLFVGIVVGGLFYTNFNVKDCGECWYPCIPRCAGHTGCPDE